MVLKYSPRFAMLLLTMYMMVAAVVYATAMPLAVRLAVLLLTSLSLLYYLARDALLRLPDSWCEVTLDQGGVAIVTGNGARLLGQIENKTIVSSLLIVLCVRLEGHRLPIARVIFPDAMSSDEYRELCVRLKFA